MNALELLQLLRYCLFRWMEIYLIVASFTIKAAENSQSFYSRIELIRQLSVSEAKKEYSAKLSGVITYSDNIRGMLYMHDGTGGIFVAPKIQPWSVVVGQKVQVTGIIDSGSHLPYIKEAEIQSFGFTNMPPPKHCSFAHLELNQEDGNWIEIQGVIHRAELRGGHLFIEIVSENKRLRAVITDVSDTHLDLDQLIDTKVSIQGVCGVVNSFQEPVFIDIHVPNFSYLKIQKTAPKSFDLVPQYSVSGLISNYLSQPIEHRIRIQGGLSRTPNNHLIITDTTGSLPVGVLKPTQMFESLRVEVVGFPAGTSNNLYLTDSIIQFFSRSWPQTSDSPSNQTNEFLPVLISAAQIHKLSQEESARGYPVRIEACVTYADPKWEVLFVQDSSSGIYVTQYPFAFNGKSGQKVLVEGFSGEGQYAPIIRATKIQILGETQYPPAKPVTLTELKSGRQDSQRVQIDGVVRFLHVDGEHLNIKIATDDGIFYAYIPWIVTQKAPLNWIDSEVRLIGVCSSNYNKKRQITGATVLVSTVDDVRVVKPQPQSPFSLPIIPIKQILQFNKFVDLRHRIHVQGTVTFRDPQWNTVFIQQEGFGLYVRLIEQPNIEVGDLIDVSGFVESRPTGPALQEAVFRKTGIGHLPQPAEITIEQAISGEYDAQLIRIDAHLIDRIPGTSGHGLILQSKGWNFCAFLENSQSAKSLDNMKIGSLLRLTGICSIQGDFNQSSRALWVQMRNSTDVEVLQKPYWWTPRRTVTAFSLGGTALITAGAWVIMLRRSVRKQTELIQRKLEREAALEAQYRDLFENVNDLIFSLDTQGKVLYCNSACVHTLGYSQAELNGMHWNKLLAPEEITHCMDLFQRALSGEKLGLIETTFIGKNGHPTHVEGSCIVSIKHGSAIALRVIFRDITSRRRAEEALQQTRQAMIQQERLAAIGQLAAGVAHDFNNILTIIQGNASLLANRNDLPPEHDLRECPKEIVEAAERAAGLTKQLLLFSRKHKMQYALLNINEVLTGMTKMIQRILGENIALVSCFQGKLPLVRGDQHMIGQILLNLAVNARDAMPQGGTLTISTSVKDIGSEQTNLQPEPVPGKYVCVEVQDSGHGIPSEVLPRIFEPFFTTKDVGKGTGLGLATVYGIITQHRGSIGVESKIGLGTTFYVYLPVTNDEVDLNSMVCSA